jgi:hypothetical protein
MYRSRLIVAAVCAVVATLGLGTAVCFSAHEKKDDKKPAETVLDFSGAKVHFVVPDQFKSVPLAGSSADDILLGNWKLKEGQGFAQLRGLTPKERLTLETLARSATAFVRPIPANVTPERLWSVDERSRTHYQLMTLTIPGGRQHWWWRGIRMVPVGGSYVVLTVSIELDKSPGNFDEFRKSPALKSYLDFMNSLGVDTTRQ